MSAGLITVRSRFPVPGTTDCLEAAGCRLGLLASAGSTIRTVRLTLVPIFGRRSCCSLVVSGARRRGCSTPAGRHRPVRPGSGVRGPSRASSAGLETPVAERDGLGAACAAAVQTMRSGTEECVICRRVGGVHLGAVRPVSRCYPQTQSQTLRNSDRLIVLTVARLEQVR